jgi:transposase
MQTIKEVLRLKYLGKQSNRRIALLGLASKSAVSNYIARFEKSGAALDDALTMNDDDLEALLFPELAVRPKRSSKPHPDWNHVHNELKKKGMTRQLLWEEYKGEHPDGLGITQFKEHYARFAKTLNPSMRQVHYAGEREACPWGTSSSSTLAA